MFSTSDFKNFFKSLAWTFEILNDGAFVITKFDDILYIGYYHNVFNNGSEERIFEPIGPFAKFNAEDILDYAKRAKWGKHNGILSWCWFKCKLLF